ncbi:MAG: HAMP domain-containing protein [Anaerolineae bacterium]|nr:HAMP domain-containing protein [Anaerolineae bacterium]
MKTLRKFFWVVHPLRAAVESLVVGVLILLLLAYLAGESTAYMMGNGWFMLCGVSGMWAVMRVRRQEGLWWRKALDEIAAAVLLSLTMTLGIHGVIALFRLQSLWRSGSFPDRISVTFLLMCIGVGYLGVRGAMRLLFLWDRMRRRRMLWALTHAHLTVVVWAAIAGIVFLGLVAPYFSMAASGSLQGGDLLRAFVQLVTTTIFPSAMIALLFTGIALVMLLPPSAVFSFLVARKTTRRLEVLTKAAEALRSGDYSARVPVVGQDEVAQLQADFNTMAETLEVTLGDLQTERDHVADLLQSRRELVASVSHELRTPVATVRGYLDAVQGHIAVLPETARQDLAVMERELLRLQHLIDDLFTLSQTEAGGLAMALQPVDVGEVVRRRVEAYAPLAWQRERVDIVAEVAPELPQALADPGRLDQVLVNLLRNALRHTPPGGIVAVIAAAEADTVCIEVRDTGEGIPPEDLPRIWERFYRGESARAEDARQGTEPGAGLGLALGKELVEAMNGSVSVSSVMGEGSCFRVCLKAAEGIMNQES